VLVPLRNGLVALQSVHAAALAEPDSLIVLPLLIVGPLYFSGLPFRTGRFAASLARAAELRAAHLFHLPAQAEAMRCAVRELAIEHDGSRCSEVLTISVGVAVVEPTAWRNPSGALQLADEALGQAKSKGRTRVELMDDVAHRLLITGEFSKDIIADLKRDVSAG
jgi:hypothetical protein